MLLFYVHSLLLGLLVLHFHICCEQYGTAVLADLAC